MNAVATFSERRALLFGIAYRMLGSVQDAEDVVQEAYMRWEKADQSAVESPKAWLSTVVTRLSIDQLRSARKQREVYVGEWLPEPLVTDAATPGAAAELADSLSTAFLVLLESLSPAERAAFLLKDVFDYDYKEIAEIVGKAPANCRQIVKRAREHVTQKRQRFDVDPVEQERMVLQFIDATTRGDIEALVGALAEDVTLHTDHGGKAIAARRVIRGASKVARFFIGVNRRFPLENPAIQVCTINGRPGVILYAGGQPVTAITFDVDGGHITNIYAVRNPDKLRSLPKPCEGN